MSDDRKTETTMPEPARPRSRVRPAGVFRAAVIAALAAGIPSAGCYMASDYGVPPDADVTDVSDAREDGETSTEDYGAPAYGIPMDAGVTDTTPESDLLYGVP